MKKCFFVLLAILIVAGLFVSCSADVPANAGVSKDVAYVTFDNSNSKGLTPGVTPADAPKVDDLYWYYQAIKATGSVYEGQKDSWTRVNSGKGLSGTIGPFSVGEWYFALVGIESNSEPTSTPNVSYELEGNTVSWTYDQESRARFIGISGTSGYETKSNVVIRGNLEDPTFIPMSLCQVNIEGDVTVNFGGLELVRSNAITNGSKVWLDVYRGESLLGDTIAVTADSGAVAPANSSRAFSISSAVEQVTLNFKLYDTEAKTYLVKEASVSFIATKGATVTLSGSLDAIEVFGTFEPANSNVAYVVSSTGEVTFYDNLQESLESVGYGEKIVLIKDVTYEDCGTTPLKFTASSNEREATLDLNGKKVLAKVINTANISLLEVGGTHHAKLTVMDSGSNGSLEVTPMEESSGWTVTVSVVAVVTNGDFVLNSGSIKNNGDMAPNLDPNPYGIDIRTNSGTDAKCTINGGSVISSGSTGMGIRAFCNSTNGSAILIVNGGYIEGDGRGVWMQNPNSDLNGGLFQLNGGEIRAKRAVEVVDARTSGDVPETKTLIIDIDRDNCTLTSTDPTGCISYNNESIVFLKEGWVRQNFDDFQITY